jgi:hypothetical protein
MPWRLRLGNKLIFVGNGGSASIASHMATDYSKNDGIRSLALNDSSMLTCLGNDLGYEQVFAKQIELHARAKIFLIAISSSGRSPNILYAVKAGSRSRVLRRHLHRLHPCQSTAQARGHQFLYIVRSIRLCRDRTFNPLSSDFGFHLR